MTSYTNYFGTILSDFAPTSRSFWDIATGATVNGTSGNDKIRGNGVADILKGGAGDDTYIVGGQGDQVFEKANEGIDSVLSHAQKFTLGANFEHLMLGTGAWYGQGNAGDNIVTATVNGQTIDGGAGNDVLVSQAKNTKFVVYAGNGSDTIYGFDATDRIQLNNYGLTSFAQVSALTRQVGSDVVLDFTNGEHLLLKGIQASSLKADNFLLSLDSSHMTKTFGDEFNSLSLLSQGGTWRTEYGWGGAGTLSSRTLASNGELQVYMDAGYNGTQKQALNIDPFSIDKGVLTITASPTPDSARSALGDMSYTSGLLTTKMTFAQQYGYFEVRAKLPAADGFWPAFWLLPSDSSWPPELDVFEQLGGDPSTVYVTAISLDANGKRVTDQERTTIDTTQWHTYGVDWEKDTISYFVDGNKVAQMATPDSMKNKEMYMLLNMAVGGWAGDPVAGSSAKMQVDYVHAFATAGTVSTTINGVKTTYTHTTPTVPTSPPPVAVTTPAAANDSYTVKQGSQLTVGSGNSVLANDLHDPLHQLSASLKTGPAHGTLALNADGTFVYKPAAGFSGQDSFTYIAKDANGATSTATAKIDVIHYLPVATGDSLATSYGSTVKVATATLLANDLAATGETLAIKSVSDAKGGTVALDGKGSVIFTPGDGFSGDASFAYTITDSTGATSQTTVKVAVAPEAKPATVYLLGSATDDLFDKHASGYGWMINGGAGNDTIIGGTKANTLNGAEGNDIIIGGAGADTITGGAGADLMTGGAGSNKFAFRPGDLVSLSSGSADRITDFHTSASGSDRDYLIFSGFGKGATLTHTGTNSDGSFIYHLTDGANSGDIVIASGGVKLGAADYLFM